MNILHISPITPARSGNGLAMRTGMFTQAAASLGTVEVLVVAAAEAAPPAAPFFLPGVSVRRVETAGRGDTRHALLSRIGDADARLAAFRAWGRPSVSAALSLPVLAEAGTLVADGHHDAVIVSRAYLLGVLAAVPAGAALPPVIVDLDDDDAALARERALLERAAGHEGAARWHEAEADAHDAQLRGYAGYARLFACASARAAASIARRLGLANVVAVANGVDIAPTRARAPDAETLLFVGNLAYGPNVDAVTWFIEAVWPRVRAARPEALLTVAGAAPASAVVDACTAPGVTLVADPDDLAPLYGGAAAAVAPLRVGSGSRIKILEAGAYGVPVVSTVKGAEGLGLDPSVHLFEAAAEASAMAAACLACLDDPAEASRRAAALGALVRQRHHRDAVVAEIAKLLEAVARQAGA